jgi:hypothetical protein
MPIPTKSSGETENEYIGRCMAAIGDEYEQDVALAICYNKFRENMNTESKVLSRIKKFREEELKGINLNEEGEVDMKAPCWDGYEQYGTKIVDGREVPNCIPID